MSTAIDDFAAARLRAARAQLEALGVPHDAAAAFEALIDGQDKRRAAMGRAEAADVRQLVLPLADAANDDTEGAAGE